MNSQELSGPELVKSFNALAESEAGQALGIKPVHKFKTLAVGQRRVETLQAAIRDYKPTAEPTAAPSNSNHVAEESDSMSKEIVDKFDPRPGSNREKAVKVLARNLGKQIPITTIVNAIYGKKDEKKIGAAKMVLVGVDLDSKGTGTVLKTEGRGKELSYGLYPRH